MITLSPNTAVILYLGLTLFTLLGIWIYYHLTTKKKLLSLPRDCLYLCEFCHFAYLDGRDKPVTSCPQCQSLNKNNEYKKNKFIAK